MEECFCAFRQADDTAVWLLGGGMLNVLKKMERETGVEPATSTLARLRSTTELFPLCKLVPEAGLEPARACTRGILSPLCLPISPLRQKMMEATPGFEPGMEILQTSALPLGYVALHTIKKWSGKRGSNPRHQPWQGCALPLSYSRNSMFVHIKKHPYFCQSKTSASLNISAVNLYSRDSRSLYASLYNPALWHTCCKKVSLSQFHSVATWGKSNPLPRGFSI